MTAPLFNLPITSPIAGASAATNGGQGALGGFEALLAAFFGPTDQAAATNPAGTGLFAAAADGEATEGADIDQAPTGDTVVADPAPALPADAMTLAALIVAPQLVPQPQTQAAAPQDGQAAAGAPAQQPAATPVSAFAPPPADVATDALPAQPSKALAVAAPEASLDTPQAQAEAPAIAAPTAKPANVEPPAKPAANPAKAAAPSPQPQAAPAPQATAAAAIADAPQAELAQAEAAAPAVADEIKPQETSQPARPARHADANRRRSDAAQPGPAAPTDDGVVAANAVTGAASAGEAGKSAAALETEIAPLALKEAKSDPAAAADTPDVQVAAPAAPSAHAHAAGQAAPVRATSETIANLTAQISKKLEGRATKFDVELTPAGLGHVSVSVEIAASGKMTAAMSFDSPQAAAEVRARSHELQRALEQAGFDLTGGLSFDVNDRGGDGRGLAQQQQQNDGAWRGRAFHAVLGTAGEAAETAAIAALQYARRSETGVDIRI